MNRSKLSLIIVVLLIATLIAMPLLVSCQTTAPSPAPSAKPAASPTAQPPAPTPVSSPAAKSIELKLTYMGNDVDLAENNMVREWGKLVGEKTNNRVTVKIFWGSVLGKVPDYLKMVGEGGIAQSTFMVSSYSQWEIPLWAASGLPFLGSGFIIPPKAIWSLYNEWSPMQEEMKKAGVVPLGAWTPHTHCIGLKDAMKSVDDLKGRKLATFVLWPELVKALGAVNVPMAVVDVYDALQKGVISGFFGLPYHTTKQWKFYEINRYVIPIPLGGVPVNLCAVNANVWNQISPEDQKAIRAMTEDLMFNKFVKNQEVEAQGLGKFYKDNNVTEQQLSAEDIAKMQTLGKDSIWGGWMKTAKEKGIPAEEFFKRYEARLKELTK